MMKPSSLKTISVFPTSVLLYANTISVSYPFVVTAISHHKNENSSIPAILVFGDSTGDSGNNDYLIMLIKSNFKPYGRDFPGGPTIRFSNGRLPSDLLAEALGVRKPVPPFLDPNFLLQDLLTGELYQLGARNIGVFGAPPVGCAPVQRTLYGDLERPCIEPM